MYCLLLAKQLGVEWPVNIGTDIRVRIRENFMYMVKYNYVLILEAIFAQYLPVFGVLQCLFA